MAKKKKKLKIPDIPKPSMPNMPNMNIIEGIQDRKFHHFWDRHPVLNNVRALIFCTASSTL